MNRIFAFILAMLVMVSLTACGAVESLLNPTEVPALKATEAPTEPECETLPTFEESRVLTYYFQEPIPYQYYQRNGEIQLLEGNKIHLRIYDLPRYPGDAVRNLMPGDLLLLGEREILVETVEISNIYEDDTYVINGGEGRDGIWLHPFAFYNVETKLMEVDYTPANSYAWKHYVLTEERYVQLTNSMNLINTMASAEDLSPEDFVKALEEHSDKLYLQNVMLDMVDSKLEGIFLLSGIDSHTDLTMIPPGNNPISPERLHFLLTGEES